jgi:hypothetical protein
VSAGDVILVIEPASGEAVAGAARGHRPPEATTRSSCSAPTTARPTSSAPAPSRVVRAAALAALRTETRIFMG